MQIYKVLKNKHSLSAMFVLSILSSVWPVLH